MANKCSALTLLVTTVSLHWCLAQIPPIPDELLTNYGIPTNDVESEQTFPRLDLGQPGADWKNGSLEMECTPGTTVSGTARSYYKMKFTDTDDYYAVVSGSGTPIEANRDYTLSLLVCYDFPDEDSEINLGVRTKNSMRDYNNDGILRQDVNGAMGRSGTAAGAFTGTSGGTIPVNPMANGPTPSVVPVSPTGTNMRWERWNYRFTSCPFTGTASLQVVPRFKDLEEAPNNPPVFAIADARLILHEAKEVKPYAAFDKTAVEFSGSTGKFTTTMRISYPPTQSGSTWQVGTSGIMFTINAANNYVSMRPRIDPVASGTYRGNVNFPPGMLNNLQLLTSGSNVDLCVVGNQYLTIGIQADSMMLIAPHQPMNLRVKGRMGGKWNRFYGGHLFSVDDLGGVSVNPDIPLGSGRLCSFTWTGSAPYFAAQYNNTTLVMKEPDNSWEVNYLIKPGERLAVGAFPPRRYEWEQSFNSNYALVQLSDKTPQEAADSINRRFGLAVCWETYFKGGWSAGGESNNAYQVKDEDKLRDTIKAIQDKGLPALIYLSPRFYHSNNMKDFIDELTVLKCKYKMSGVYYDGLPPDWQSAYYVMRETRRLFPDGMIILHASMTPPLYMPDMLCPFIDTYADITLRGETVPANGVGDQGIDWQFAHYAVSQYNVANCIGIMKASTWKLDIPGCSPLAGTKEVAPFLKILNYGGRGRRSLPEDARTFTDIYHDTVLQYLKNRWEHWRNEGSHGDFYRDVYLPEAESSTTSWLIGIH